MANIKNKKNITMGNMKTLMATSVLCVFFNGVAIYGMQDENKNSGFNSSDDITSINANNNIKNNNFNFDNMKFLINQQFNENEILYKNDKTFKKRNKEEDSSIFLNYKGNFSLLFCCNFCNNKKENQMKYRYEQQKKMLEKDDDFAENLLKKNFAENLLKKNFAEKNDNRLLLDDYSEGDFTKKNINNNENNSVPINNTNLPEKK